MQLRINTNKHICKQINTGKPHAQKQKEYVKAQHTLTENTDKHISKKYKWSIILLVLSATVNKYDYMNC